MFPESVRDTHGQAATGRSPPGNPLRRWEDIIKMDLKEMCGYGMDSTGSSYGAVPETF
jgi:hypothetical protein